MIRLGLEHRCARHCHWPQSVSVNAATPPAPPPPLTTGAPAASKAKAITLRHLARIGAFRRQPRVQHPGRPQRLDKRAFITSSPASRGPGSSRHRFQSCQAAHAAFPGLAGSPAIFVIDQDHSWLAQHREQERRIGLDTAETSSACRSPSPALQRIEGARCWPPGRSSAPAPTRPGATRRSDRPCGRIPARGGPDPRPRLAEGRRGQEQNEGRRHHVVVEAGQAVTSSVRMQPPATSERSSTSTRRPFFASIAKRPPGH